MRQRTSPLVSLAVLLLLSAGAVRNGWCAEGTVAASRSDRLSFRDVGCYGEFLDFADFAFLKISVDKPEDVARIPAFNERMRRVHARGGRIILGLYTYDRITHSQPPAKYLARTDAVLGALDRSLVYAVCPGEENVTWNRGTQVLNALYDRITQKWRMPCYQWLSMPYPPQAEVKADGWILDAYGYDRAKFRRHLIRFLLTGKPVVVCVNASAPSGRYAAEKVPPYDPDSPAQAQMEVCREFGVPVFFYAVDRQWGNVWAWLRDTDRETVRCRRWAMEWIERAHGLPPGYDRNVVSARFLEARPMEVCGGADNSFRLSWNFSDTSFADHAGMENLASLRWNGRARSLTFLPVPKGGRVRLYWHAAAPAQMEILDVSIRIRGLLRKKGGSVRVGAGTDLVHWQSRETTEAGTFDLSASTPREWRGKDCWVAVDGEAPTDGNIRIQSVEIVGHTSPPSEKTIRLHPTAERSVLYRDDFSTPKLMHFADVAPPGELHWRKGEWYITGRKGSTNRVRIRLRFAADEPLKDAELRIGATAWTRDHAAKIRFALSKEDGRPLVVRDTASLPQDKKYHRFSGTVILPFADSPGLRDVRTFVLSIEMINASGVAAGPSNFLKYLEVRGRRLP